MNHINDYLEKFARLSLRERLLVLLVSTVVLYFLFDTLLLTPQNKRIQQLQQAAQAHQNEDDLVKAKLIVIETDKSKSADQLKRQREEIATLQQQISAAERYYSVSDQNKTGLSELLHKLLAANPHVTLGDLRTQAPVIFFSTATQASKAKPQASQDLPVNTAVIYRSTVDLSLEGSYPDLLSYLKTLEQRATPLFWTSALLEVKAYPQVALKLNITTLGAEANSPLN